MSTDTTPGAVDHADAIRKIASHWATFFGPFIHNDNLWYTDTFMDGKDAGEIGSDMTEVKRHAAALDAARIAAEARLTRMSGSRDYWEDVANHHYAARIAAEAKLAAEQERVARLQAAFLKAESRVEAREANQDQTYEIWVQRWGLHPDDLHADPARRDRDADAGEGTR